METDKLNRVTGIHWTTVIHQVGTCCPVPDASCLASRYRTHNPIFTIQVSPRRFTRLRISWIIFFPSSNSRLTLQTFALSAPLHSCHFGIFPYSLIHKSPLHWYLNIHFLILACVEPLLFGYIQFNTHPISSPLILHSPLPDHPLHSTSSYEMGLNPLPYSIIEICSDFLKFRNDILRGYTSKNCLSD